MGKGRGPAGPAIWPHSSAPSHRPEGEGLIPDAPALGPQEEGDWPLACDVTKSSRRRRKQRVCTRDRESLALSLRTWEPVP